MVGAWGWIPLALGLFWMAARYPIEPGRILPRLALHTGAVLVVIVLRAAFIYSLDPFLHWYDAEPDFQAVLVQSVWNNFFQAWLVIGVGHALVFSDRAREREAQASRLQSQLAEARLEALSSRLNPHFLFNALNSIAELVHRDADAADRMIIGLSALLRSSLEQAVHSEVPLEEELRLLGHYLDIEKIRLGERLRVEWDIGSDTRDALVPPLLLQPLVENAVRHGISRRLSPGCIRVQSQRQGGELQIEIRDDGNEPGSAGAGFGIGLATTRDRLTALYGSAADLELRRDPGPGTSACLRLPFRRQRRAA
jgi:LytS/YehU family sensor histidine kinase